MTQVQTTSRSARCKHSAMTRAFVHNNSFVTFSPGKPAGYLYMNVGNGRRDLSTQNYGNTMLKLQPPMNQCACGALCKAVCYVCAMGNPQQNEIKLGCSADPRHDSAQGCWFRPLGSQHPAWHCRAPHTVAALPCRAQSWKVAGVFTPMGNSYPVPLPNYSAS